jgi:hypothetical protein
MYLQGEIEQGLEEAERYLTLFSPEASKTLREVAQGLYQLARNLRRNKGIPVKIAANLQVCYKNLMDLAHEAGKKASSTINTSGKELIKTALLRNLKSVRDKINVVESLLVLVEKQEQKGNRSQLRA